MRVIAKGCLQVGKGRCQCGAATRITEMKHREVLGPERALQPEVGPAGGRQAQTKLRNQQQLRGGQVCMQGQLQAEKEACYTGGGLPIQSGRAMGTSYARCRRRHGRIWSLVQCMVQAEGPEGSGPGLGTSQGSDAAKPQPTMRSKRGRGGRGQLLWKRTTYNCKKL